MSVASFRTWYLCEKSYVLETNFLAILIWHLSLSAFSSGFISISNVLRILVLNSTLPTVLWWLRENICFILWFDIHWKSAILFLTFFTILQYLTSLLEIQRFLAIYLLKKSFTKVMRMQIFSFPSNFIWFCFQDISKVTENASLLKIATNIHDDVR